MNQILRNAIANAGPFKVLSQVNGQLRIMPMWPDCKQWNEQDGGGPGVLERMALAEAIETLLNDIAADLRAAGETP